MYDNQLTGLIPTSLANISGLEEIDLSQNQFSGKIPANFGMLKNLSWLSLEDNQLEAKEVSDWDFIQSLTNCTMLDHLSLDTNNLSGSLPSEVGNLSTGLSWLTMSDNQITGEIPSEISNLANLNNLGLQGNQFSGKIPDSICHLTNLESFILYLNQLSGPIPSCIGNFTRLNEFYLAHNQLQGEIPPSIGNCKNLNILDLSRNRLSGSIPKELLSLSSLSYYLSLSHNLLSGPLPPEIARLQSLSYLDISDNNLSDQIPNGLGQCLALETLTMNNNFFNESIPVSFKNLRGLKVLDLSNNNLSGDFPDYLAEFPYLQHLNLSFNELTGKVPTNGIFANQTAVSVLGNNQICGGISSLDLPTCPGEAPKKENHLVVKIAVPIASVILLVILVPCLYIVFISKRNSRSKRRSFKVVPLEGPFFNISYAELENATDNFSFDNLIGVGSYGSVFKGNLGGDEFIAGQKVAAGFCEGIRVREAQTEAFTVKNHRGELYKKHYPPALKDEVWRLEKIGKDGAFHKKLNAKGINTVEDFLRLLIHDQQGLRNILGSAMSNKMWDNLIEHAKTCVLSGKHYIFYADHTRNTGAVFNNFYEFVAMINGAQFYSAESLTENQRLMADTLVKKAYDNWNTHVIEYDGEALLSFKQEKKAVSTRSNNKASTPAASASGFAGAGSSNMALPVPAPAVPSLIGEVYKKHYPPALKDEVWRLEKIGKDGAFHKKLNAKGINTVEDFLRLLIRDQQGLRNILGSAMSNKMWDNLVEHAMTCVLSGKHYIFYADHTRNTGAVFNNIYEFVGMINGAQFYSAESLTENQRLMAGTLVKKAYDNWNTHVIEYDGEALLSFKQEKKAVSTRSNNKASTPAASASGFTGAGSSNMALAVPAPADRSLIGEGDGSKLGYNMGHSTTQYPSNQPPMQFDRSPFIPEPQFNGTQLIRNSASTSMRSHEIPENEEMQHLLRVLTMGGAQGTSGMADDGYGFSSYMNTPA